MQSENAHASARGRTITETLSPRRALGAGRANVWTPPGVPLFIGLLDRSPIWVVFIGCALRGRVPIAALCISISIFFRVRRATGNCPNDLIYYAWFLWCTISGILCEPDGRYKHECCRGHCCYELHGKSPVVRMAGSGAGLLRGFQHKRRLAYKVQ